eukprot:261004-Hanusia_phi.AAC.5
MSIWITRWMRSGLPPMMRMPKKAAAAAEKKKIVQEYVAETSKPGDPIPGLNYMKDGKGHWRAGWVLRTQL